MYTGQEGLKGSFTPVKVFVNIKETILKYSLNYRIVSLVNIKFFVNTKTTINVVILVRNFTYLSIPSSVILLNSK